MPRANTGSKLIVHNRGKGSAGVYHVQWTPQGERTRTQSTGILTSEPDGLERAEDFHTAWKAELKKLKTAKKNGPGRAHQVKVAAVIELFYADRGKSKAEGGVVSQETLMYGARPLIHFFADDTVASMTPNRVKAYWKWRRHHGIEKNADNPGDVKFEVVDRKIGDGTIIRELGGVLRPALKHAINEGVLERGTYGREGTYQVPVPASPPGRDYFISRPEAAKLVRETTRDKRSRLHLPLYTLIALYTGARSAAIKELTWGQVNLARGTIDFNPPGRVQTAKRRPHIPLPLSLWAALRRAHARRTCDYVIAYRGEAVGSVKTGFNSAAERAGVADCTSHTLRHTAATWMAQDGVPLWEIAGYLGQSLERTTVIYLHHTPEHLRGARESADGRRRRAAAVGRQLRAVS